MFEFPLKIAFIMRDFKPDWFIAGGWAIDLFIGEQTRSHEDIEIAIFRKNQFELQNYLEKWDLRKAVNGELIEWKKDEFLELPIHEIHCFNENIEPKSFEVLLNESNAEKWVFRRNQNVTKPVSELYLLNNSGLKFLRPEVVLLYKSKNPRARDEQDFRTAFQHLDYDSKEWLKNALSISYSRHHWLESLKAL